jgi:transporter family-2 protein
VNGRFGATVGSSTLAAVVNQVVGLSALLALAVASGALMRAVRRIRAGARVRWWHPMASINGAVYVTVTSAAAPKVGVALLSVALVAGQTGGALLADRVGLSPAGRRYLTRARVVGVALALVAVVIGALGKHGELHLHLLMLAVVAGAGMAVVQSGVGHVSRVTGEPLVAGIVSFAVGGVCVALVALVVTGASPPNGWSAPPELWTGGLIGAATGVVMAVTVRVLGVLRLTLSIVAGQTVGALIIDFAAPAAGAPVTLATGVSVALTLLAVAVSGTTLRSRVRVPRRSQPGSAGS